MPKLGLEDLQRRGDETCGPVGMTAGAAARHLAEPALDPGAVGLRTLERARDRVEAVDARPTLPGGLVCEEPDDARRRADAARAAVEDGHRPHADRPA